MLTSFANAEQIMMVWAKQVDLYDERGKIVRVLNNGQLVQVENFAKDPSRFLVKFNNKTYNAKKAYFKKPADIVVLYKKQILEYEAKIKQDELELSNIESDLIVRYVQALELQRDTALAYQNVQPAYNQTGPQGYFRGYTSILTQGKFKKLMKAWSAEVEKITAKKEEILVSKRKYSIAVEKLKYRIASFENLGEMFAAKANSGNDYLVVQENAPLYVNNKVVKHLDKGDTVLARPHPKFANWYEVLVEKKKYVAPGSALVKKSDYSRIIKEKMINSKVLVAQLNSEVEIQQFRLKLYQGVSRQLEADKFVHQGYGLVKNLIVPIEKDRSFTIRSPKADQVYVNSVVASKVLKEWKANIAGLSAASLQNQKKVLALKKQLIDLEEDLKLFKK